MSYRFDQYDNSIVIDGFENGIADSPHTGLADMRNINIVSVPGEASVNFKTTQTTPPTITAVSVTSADATANTIAYVVGTGILAGGMAVTFSASTIGGVSINTVYWLGNASNISANLYSDPGLNNLVDITLSGTGTFTVYTLTAAIKYFTYDSSNYNYGVDGAGRVWSNVCGLDSNGNYRYLGNKPNNNSSGTGIATYTASNGDIYIFVFSNSSIDYCKNPSLATAWTYQWNISAGTTGAFNASPSSILKTASGVANSHEALLAPDNRVYFCDANWVGVFYETNPSTAFNPADLTTYTFAQYRLLPSIDLAQCLTFLGTNLMIGGIRNVIYPWDRSSTNFNYPLLLPEYNVAKMVTLNTSTYIFIGNRGRIYITNGTNVQLFKKVPDHISGTIEPYFTWGGASTFKNQIYFGVSVAKNTGATISQYGGLWAIDTDTKALRLTNKLSYGTYAGYVSAISPVLTSGFAAGTGLIIGWDSGASTYGIDSTSSNPYSAGESTIDSDLIPIGTFNKTRDFTQLEYKLSVPLVSGESIAIKTRLIFNTTDTGFSTGWTDSYTSPGQFSNTHPIDFQQAQWVQFKIVLTSTTSSPSYTRLKQIRLLGLTGPTMADSQQLSL